MDLPTLAHAFNEAVTSGSWHDYLTAFSPTAVLEFVGPPVGPFRGRDAIAEAYSASPPDDTIELVGNESTDGPESVSAYRWASTGATGTMRLSLDTDGLVTRLVVTFD